MFQLKPLLVESEKIIDTLSSISLLHSLAGEEPVLIDAEYLILSSQRIKHNSLTEYSVQTRLGGIRLPYSSSVYENVTKEDLDIA